MDSPPVSGRARALTDLLSLEPAARQLELERLAQVDPSLAAELVRLLALDEDEDGPLEILRGEVAAVVDRRVLEGDPDEAYQRPERLGPWLLGERLGVGGMGEVWAAERIDGGFTQQAAVKLVRAGMASPEVVARFAVERQVLARLVHPAIARLLDGGLAPDGRPWFAMELVDGLPITSYAAEHELSLEARLSLVVAVTKAVEYAHRNLIVHRDLKPSNVLVTAAGEPKLLDFGLAKLLDLEGDVGVTRTEQRALTPAYAAPEQVLGEPITTATDVYALGVVLYELLTGELPHRRLGGSQVALVDAVSRETVERPSVRLRRLAKDPLSVRDARRLAGDLDTIVVKALASEPERRYPSSAALAADLVAYLEGRPIAARPDSWSYRTAKFVRRHRLGVAAGGLVATAVVVALGVSLVQTRRADAAAAAARAEAQRAERVKAFLVSVFEQADPSHALGAEITARQILDEGSRRLDEELEGEPEVRAELLDAVARIQVSLGLLEQGRANAELAVAERGRLFGESSAEAARSRVTLGNALLSLGRRPEAAKELAQAEVLLVGVGDKGSPELVRAVSGQAQVLMLAGDLHGAIALERRAHELAARSEGPASTSALEHLSNLAVIETELGRYEESVRIYRELLERLPQLRGPDHPEALAVEMNLATSLDLAGKSDEALPLFERNVAARRRVLGATHPQLAEALVIASLRLSRAGRSQDALAYLDEARAIYGPINHPELASVDGYRGLVLAELERFPEAEASMRAAVTRYTADLGEGDVFTINARANLANVVLEQGRAAEAVALFEPTIAALRTLGEFDNPRLLRNRLQFGAALRAVGRFADSRAVLTEALALGLDQLGPEHLRVAEIEVELGLTDALEPGDDQEVRGAAAAVRLARAEAIVATARPGTGLRRGLERLRAALGVAAHGTVADHAAVLPASKPSANKTSPASNAPGS